VVGAVETPFEKGGSNHWKMIGTLKDPGGKKLKRRKNPSRGDPLRDDHAGIV